MPLAGVPRVSDEPSHSDGGCGCEVLPIACDRIILLKSKSMPASTTKNAKTRATNSAASRKAAPKTKTAATAKAGKPALLSGGNPQIAKGYGDAPVQAYIAAMPDWKSAAGKQIDTIITRAVPDVQKAVKWNSPFYGMDEQHWFLSFHCFDKYIKIAFFRGAALEPVPPVTSKQKDVRYLHIHQDDAIDEAQFASWVKQASELPGEKM